MKALSLKPEWALPVLLGFKTVECRSWRTDYRGDLLICSSSRSLTGYINGRALCVVRLDDVVPFEQSHLRDAFFDEMPESSYAWIFSDLRWVEPFPVKGQLSLYEVDDSLIKMIPESIPNEEALRCHYLPLVKWGRGDSEMRDLWSELTGKEVAPIDY